MIKSHRKGKGNGTLIRKMGGWKAYYDYLDKNGGKIGRNVSCPCGSGIKYKKCSIKKHTT